MYIHICYRILWQRGFPVSVSICMCVCVYSVSTDSSERCVDTSVCMCVRMCVCIFVTEYSGRGDYPTVSAQIAPRD